VVDHMFRFITSRRESLDLPPEIIDLLRGYHWPGNLRELHNVIERAWILSDGRQFNREHFAGLLPGGRRQAPGAATASTMDLHSAERQHIVQILGKTNGSVPEAAKILGVSRATLYRKISQHNIELGKTR